jgi:hypothetical protein
MLQFLFVAMVLYIMMIPPVWGIGWLTGLHFTALEFLAAGAIYIVVGFLVFLPQVLSDKATRVSVKD